MGNISVYLSMYVGRKARSTNCLLFKQTVAMVWLYIAVFMPGGIIALFVTGVHIQTEYPDR